VISADLKKIAVELVIFLAELRDSGHLCEILGTRKVLTRCSEHECDRTIELQVLEIDGEQIEVGAFSDGLTGSVGVGAVFYPEGVKLLSAPKLYVQGVPTDEIDISST
jgi:hypothetical protein